MPYFLKNKDLELQIDLPLENYHQPRFDWTGKIVGLNFKGHSLAGIETTRNGNQNNYGKGFYNEFGIEIPVGFEEVEIGGWFHKIGIGLLKKDSQEYQFFKKYEIQPADFQMYGDLEKFSIICNAPLENGFAYILKKEIRLKEDGFIITYHLQNTGEKLIQTNEYTHNFLTVDGKNMGEDYILKFPFNLALDQFEEFLNKEKKLEINGQKINFNGTPEEQFFASYLSGKKKVNAHWELIHKESQIAISETGNFQSSKVNLWGWKHVISPELFFPISLAAGKSVEWERAYRVYEIS